MAASRIRMAQLFMRACVCCVRAHVCVAHKTQLAAVDTLASPAPQLVLRATAAIPSKTRLNAALEDSQIAHLSLLGDPRSTDSA